jgi:hypothetical protein
MLTKAITAIKGAIEALEASRNDLVLTTLHKYDAVIKNSLALAGSENKDAMKLLKLMQQPNSKSYSFASNEVIATLQSLLKVFKQKKVQADQEEQADRQAHEMQAGARRNTIKGMEKAKAEKQEQSAAIEEEINTHQTDLQETEAAHAADQNFLNDLTAKCEQKAADWDQRSTTRSNELTSITQAMEMLKNDVSKLYESTGLGLVVRKSAEKAKVAKKAKLAVKSRVAEKAKVAEKSRDEKPHFKAMPQSNTPRPPAAIGGHWQWVPDKPAKSSKNVRTVSFLQVEKPATAAKKAKAMQLLADRAESLKSPALSTLVLKLRETPSPFAKVKQMINDLVSRLEAEAEAEASQKAWCDEEMAAATSMRDTAQTTIETLGALKTEKGALIDSLSEDILTLSQQISDLQKALKEETELREQDSAANNVTMEDAVAGKGAVENAIVFLSDFYGGSEAAPKLLQVGQEPVEGYERFTAENAGADGKTVDDMAPDAAFDGEYGGKTDAAKGIMGLLEVIVSDFENTISKTETLESEAQASYETFKTDTETDITDKGDLKTTKEGEKTDAELAITQAESDLRAEMEVLQNALDELEKLKPVCVDSGMSWEERKARREQEVASLKEALEILQNTDFGL